jgi:hypothetical protein
MKSNPKFISLQSLRNINPTLDNYHGSVNYKPQSIGKYRISLIIENSPNYLSEKLFDALVSQSIAIYVGIDLSKIGLNNEMAIQVNHSSDSIAEEISRIIQLSNKEQHDIYIKQQNEFRKVLGQWNNEFVFSIMAKEIHKLSSQ